MSSTEFTQWLAFFSIEPWPEQRQDFNAAYVQTAVIGAATGKPPKPKDLVPDYWKHQQQQDPAVMKRKLESLVLRGLAKKVNPEDA